MSSERHIAEITFPDGNVVAARRSRAHPGSYEVISFVATHEPLVAFTGTRSLALSAIELASHKPVPLRPVMAPVSRRSAIGLGAGAAVLVVGGGGLIGWKTGLFDRGEAANSIAILPFRNLSPDPEQAFFSQGLTEELRSALSRNDSLKVIAGASHSATRRTLQGAFHETAALD